MGGTKSNKSSASKNKKQTRLTFEPVDPSSSPAPSGKPSAKVRYAKPSSSLSKRPIPSSSAQVEDDSDSDDIILSSTKPTAKSNLVGMKKKGSLEEDSEDEIAITSFSPQTTRVSAQKNTNSRNSSARKSIPQAKINLSEGSDLEEEYTPSKGKKNNGRKVPSVVLIKEDGQTQKPKNTMQMKRGATPGGVPVKISPQKAQAYVEISSGVESDNLELPRRHPGQTKKSLFSKVPLGKSSSPRKLSEDSDSDSDEVVMSTKATRRKSRPAVTSRDDDEESDGLVSSLSKRGRAKVESDDSDVISSPLKRRKAEVFSEDETSEDDLQSIRNEPKSSARAPTPSRTTRQSMTRRHRTEKEKNLELLKRRRAGEQIEELTDTEESESEDDEASDFQELTEFEDDDEEVVAEKPRKPAKPAKKERDINGDGKDLDAYDSDFIEDDDEGDLGVPAHYSLLDIPLEFTQAAHKPMKEHFRDAVEWMVHNKINPAFSRDDPIYANAFKKLDDEYTGYAKSKFISTQWTAEFTRALSARPEFLVRNLAPGEEIEIAGEVICQVCNHRKYVPKYEIQFAGKAYHKDSLEDVEADSSSDDSESEGDGSTGSVNVDGQVIPPETQTWLSGQYCKANAEQAHSMIHWKYSLNQWVIDNLEAQGHLTPKKLAAREKMKAKQRRKYANDIVDDWEEHNHIKGLYRDFKINLEAARNATSYFKNGRFRGG